MPGEGTIYIAQKSSFLKPVYLGDTITVTCEIVEIVGRKATIKNEIYNQNAEKVLEGESRVLLPEED